MGSSCGKQANNYSAYIMSNIIPSNEVNYNTTYYDSQKYLASGNYGVLNLDGRQSSSGFVIIENGKILGFRNVIMGNSLYHGDVINGKFPSSRKNKI